MSAVPIAPARAAFGWQIRDRVALVLALLAAGAVPLGAFLTIAPNRLADGEPFVLPRLGVPAAAVAFALVALLFAAAFARDRILRTRLLLLSGVGLMSAVLLIAGFEASAHLDPQQPARRISLGSGFWMLFAIALLTIFQALQHASRFWKVALPLALVGLFAALVLSGVLDSLSLAREFHAQRTTFPAEFLRHIGLVVTAMVLALVFALPLIWAAVYRPRSRAAIFTVLNLLQTIPSIALFGLLIAPLSLLSSRIPLAREFGIGGIGAAPAIIALVLYGLLPLVRSADAGLRNVPGDVRESARGMGMTPRQILWRVDLPLAMPALVSGLRVATVQSIGLATVAALIGAGGLGTFVFQGIGEYALDLVLVGALPTILLAVAADALFQIALASLRSRA